MVHTGISNKSFNEVEKLRREISDKDRAMTQVVQRSRDHVALVEQRERVLAEENKRLRRQLQHAHAKLQSLGIDPLSFEKDLK